MDERLDDRAIKKSLAACGTVDRAGRLLRVEVSGRSHLAERFNRVWPASAGLGAVCPRADALPRGYLKERRSTGPIVSPVAARP